MQSATKLDFPVPEVLATYDEPVSLLVGLVPGTSRPAESEIEIVAPEYMELIAPLNATEPVRFPIEQATMTSEVIEVELECWTGLAAEGDPGSGDRGARIAIDDPTE